jgi:tRNA A-37 threonylcarbamoyl transferase component Bud32/tetratricopeptide (TPR) repeat protein
VVTPALKDQLQESLGASYTLEHELTGGGMSRVFLATETSLGRKVVVKVLPPELGEGVSVERFKREIQLAAQLQQAHIVPVLTAGETNGLPFYTMPFVDGHSLRARLTKAGPLPISEAISVLRDVAKALAYAHERGVVHRDIKPDNVLLSGGSAVVTDFGVAKALSASKTAAPATTLTQVGTSLGTPAYMAPEQVAADPGTNHRADIYAFGVMAYEMLAGQSPFFGRSPQKLLAAQMAERPVPIAQMRPDTPPLLAELVMRCLEKEPDDRPQSAADIVRVLETVTSGTGTPAMPSILLGGRRRLGRALLRYALAFVGVVIVAKAAVIAIGLPDWVFPGAVGLMALGLPAILFTAFVQHSAHKALTTSAVTPRGSPTAAHSTIVQLAVRASPWVSWRKTTIGGVLAMSAFAVLVIAFMATRALGIGPAGSLLASGKLTDKERLLVTDFRASGADSSLGGIVTEAVRTDLGQSASVSVVPPSDVAAALGRMGRAGTTRIDLPLAREIATREGLKAIVDGDITPLAGGYVMTIRLVGAERGDELASYRGTIDGPKELLPTLDHLTRELRAKIGESLAAVRASPKLDQVTTPSLEALRKYVDASRASDVDVDYPKAIGLLQEAVSLDTTFAMAYRKLGVVLNNAWMPEERVDAAIGKAYHYRDRLTERERYLATASYFDGPGHDRQQAANAYDALLARDSLDEVAVNNMAILARSRRDFPRAEALWRREIAILAASNAYGGLIRALIDEGRPVAAESALLAVRAALPGSPLIGPLDGLLLYDRGRIDSAAARFEQVREGDPAALLRARATYQLGDLAMLRGRLAESERLEADAAAQDVARGAVPPPLIGKLDSAWIDIWFREQPGRGVQKIDAVLARMPLRTLPAYERPYFRVATLYALAGRPDRAHAILTQYEADVQDSALRRRDEPGRHTARAEIALAEKRPLDAVAEFKLGDRLPDGPVDECTVCLPARLGRAYDQAGVPDSAIVLYERYIATPNSIKLTPSLDPALLAGMHKRLGELYESKGERQQAIGHYLTFVELWKNADPELQPQVADVTQRLARLRAAEPH